ncbi:MAG: hypothetical protein AB8B62_02355 [Roseobacter sp.]
MNPHPDFADGKVPQSVTLGIFRMDMLTADDLDADYAAVMASRNVLQGVFAPGWPVGMTREEDALDLNWHHREFIANRSYAWVVRTHDHGYVGCAYLYPDIGTTGSGTAVYWMIDAPERPKWLEAFGPQYTEWLRTYLPAGYDLNVINNA